MTLSVTHAFVSAKADGTDNTKVQPSNWNAQHAMTAALNSVLGTDGSGTTVKELPNTAAGLGILAAANAAAQKTLLNVAEIPIGGGFMWFSGTLPPSNGTVVWGWANGQAISRATYAALFGQWGSTFGVGDGSTTFNVPDMRDVVPVGVGTMGGVAARGLITNQSSFNNSINANQFWWGEAAHGLSVNEMPVHTHTNGASTAINEGGGHAHTSGSWTSSTGTVGQGAGGLVQFMTGVGISTVGGVTGTWNTTTNTTGITASTTVTINNNGGNLVHNNIQPSFSVGWVIRLA